MPGVFDKLTTIKTVNAAFMSGIVPLADYGLRNLGLLDLTEAGITSPKPFLNTPLVSAPLSDSAVALAEQEKRKQEIALLQKEEAQQQQANEASKDNQSQNQAGGEPAADQGRERDPEFHNNNDIFGVDCTLVHGNCFNKIGTGLSMLTTVVEGSQTDKVEQNRYSTIYGDDDETIYGNSNYTYIDAQNISHSHTVTVNYAAPLQVNQPTSAWELKWTSLQLYFFQFTAAVLQITINYQNITVIIPAPDPMILLMAAAGGVPPLYITLVAGLNMTLDAIHLDNTFGPTLEWKSIMVALGLMEADVKAGEAKVGPTAQAGPHVGVPASLGAN
jgi:hypothetical protein